MKYLLLAGLVISVVVFGWWLGRLAGGSIGGFHNLKKGSGARPPDHRVGGAGPKSHAKDQSDA